MPELSKKLDRFTSILLSEATAETERTLQKLRKRHDAALASAEDQVLLEAYEYIHSEVGRIRSEQGRCVSRHLLECKQELYHHREVIADEVFAQVRSRLAAFTRTQAYGKRMNTLLLEALDRLVGAEDVVIFLREEDLPLAKTLHLSAHPKPEFRPGPIRLGGLIAQSATMGLRLDASFDAAMEELDGHFASLVGFSLADAAGDDVLSNGSEDAK